MVANKNEENQPMSEDEVSAEIQAAGDDEASAEVEESLTDRAIKHTQEVCEAEGYVGLYSDDCLKRYARLYIDHPQAWAAVDAYLSAWDGIKATQLRDWISRVKKTEKALKKAQRDEKKEQERDKIERELEEHASAGGVIFYDPVSDTEIALELLQKLEGEDGEKLCFDLGEMWGYVPSCGLWESIWRKGYEGPLSRQVQAFDGSPVVLHDGMGTLPINSSRTNAVIEVACEQRQGNPWPAPFFDNAPRGITFADCFVRADLKARNVEVREHSPHNRARVGLPFDFDTEATCEGFDEYLREVFEPDEDVADKITLIWEMIGAGLLGFASNESLTGKMFMLFGEGGTGKSTLIEIIQALFPPEAVTSIPPQAFSDEYARADLEGKLLNVVNEAPADNVLNDAGLKAIAHGQPVRARQIYKEATMMKSRALHVFAANKLPSGPGLTGAFWDRWMVIEFNRRFRDTADVKPELHKDIIANELPGIAARAIDAARRLLERGGGYTLPESSARRLDAWKGQDPVKQFFAEETSQANIDRTNISTWTPAKEVWDAWNYYRDENGFSRMNRNTFDSRAEQAGYPIRKTGVRRMPCTIKVELRDRIEEHQRKKLYF